MENLVAVKNSINEAEKSLYLTVSLNMYIILIRSFSVGISEI